MVNFSKISFNTCPFLTKPQPLTSRRGLYKWTIEIIREHRIKPRRKLGQNFIIEPQLIKTILNVLAKYKTVKLLELGTGLGTLSYYLSRFHDLVYSVHFEVDEKLCDLTNTLLSMKALLVCSDGLVHNWYADIFVSNLPYYITSDTLVKIAKSNDIKTALIIVQKDVANRILAKPGTREYGRLTILLNLLFEIIPSIVIDPGGFWPRPKVYSQLIIMRRLKDYDEDVKYVEETTRLLFNMRRKKVIKVLRHLFSKEAYSIIQEALINRDKRVYELSLGEVQRLSKILRKRGFI